MKQILILIGMLLWGISYSQDSLTTQVFKENARPLMINEGEWSGEGSEFILKAADENHFFLIGEYHGIADVALFTSSLLSKIKDKGYQYFISETGPYTAGILESYEDDFNKNIGDHLRKYPLSFPFYNYREEAEVLKVLMDRNTSYGPATWGLDQEFAASYRMFFQWLYDTALTDESKMVAKEYADLAQTAFNESFKKKNPAASIMGRLSPKDFDRLEQTFQGQEAGLDLIEELRETTTIYQLWFQGGGYQSNMRRAALMKKHFNRYYSQVKDDPNAKVLGKMGANHFYKGRSPLNILDIGNHIHEIALQDGKSSFHMFVLPKRGTSNSWNPFTQDEADKTKPFDTMEDGGKVDLSPLIKGTSDDHYSIVDMRPIRKMLFDRKLKIKDQGLERLIWSYDAILVMPQVTAATNYD
ncbi:MAG: hypothetical protein HKN68_13245 [Saprospiraceae bacterium]|nr:hypothetical protein [Saprospiraceae bacterium]